MFRTVLTVGALLLIPASAYAQHHGHGPRGNTTNNTGIGVATSGSASQAAAVSNSGVVINNPATVTTLGNSRIRQSGSLRTTASAFASQLVASAVGTCLGSTSFGIGLTGIGLSGGSTHADRPCNLRMYSAALLAAGQQGAAAAVLCHDPLVYNAFASVGVRCPLVPEGYATVSNGAYAGGPPVRAAYIPAGGNGQVIEVRGESYEHQEAKAAASRLQDEYRRNGALR